MENLDNFAGHGEPQPWDTTAAVQLLDLFRNPDHDVDQIVELISQDPLLTAETLRRCNNATFGSGERTTDIFEAVSRLGFYELYDIIATSVVTYNLPPGSTATNRVQLRDSA
jgi:HD-like signal output (HDOD) protein